MLEIVEFAVSRGVSFNGSDVVGVSGRILKPRSIGKYLGYQIPMPNGGFINVYAHKLIYYLTTGDVRAFSDDFEIHHKNDDRYDNRPENLELKTEHEHASMHSTLNTRNTKITLERARELREEYLAGGISQKELARRNGLSQQHLSDIIRGKKWGSKWD